MDEIRKKYNLKFIALHGSQVTGNIHTKSDVDIAVARNKLDSGLDILGLISDLTVNLKSDRVDVVDITSANPLLLFSVMKKSRLLSGSKKDYEKMMKLSFHKYSDYLPYLKMESDFVKERIASYA